MYFVLIDSNLSDHKIIKTTLKQAFKPFEDQSRRQIPDFGQI